MPREINPKYQKEALTKIVEAAKQAKEGLNPALGQRHFVLGVGGDNGDKEDLYWLILQAETAILKVMVRAQHQLAKR